MQIKRKSSKIENPRYFFMAVILVYVQRLWRLISQPLTNQKRSPGKKIPIKATTPIINCARRAFLRFSGVSGDGGLPQSSSLHLSDSFSSFTKANHSRTL